MVFKDFNYKEVLERILICPSDNRLKSSKSFWIKETTLFKRLYKKYPNPKFWSSFRLYDTNCENGKIPSLAYFLDGKNHYWSTILRKKWKKFNWVPPKFKSYNFKNDLSEDINYEVKKKNLRDFFN